MGGCSAGGKETCGAGGRLKVKRSMRKGREEKGHEVSTDEREGDDAEEGMMRRRRRGEMRRRTRGRRRGSEEEENR